MEDRIRAKAADLGFCKVGFTTMNDFPRVSGEATRRAYPTFFRNMIERGSHPRELWPQGASIIVLAYDYSRHRYPDNLVSHIGRTYLSRSYLPLEDSPARLRLDAFESFLADEGIGFEPDRNALMMRPAALRAGVASFGRNNFCYVDGVGSFVILYGYIVDVELQPSAAAPNCVCPPHCRACIEACPTKALKDEFDLHLERCILWDNAIAPKRGDGPDVPLDHRDAIGAHVHGCDVCREVCPMNSQALRHDRPGLVEDPVVERISQKFSLEALLHMPDGFYEECVFPIMYNYSRDPAVFQRNAAVAMGNSGDTRYIAHLQAELANPNPVVRSHVAWALEKLQAQS